MSHNIELRDDKMLLEIDLRDNGQPFEIDHPDFLLFLQRLIGYNKIVPLASFFFGLRLPEDVLFEFSDITKDGRRWMQKMQNVSEADSLFNIQNADFWRRNSELIQQGGFRDQCVVLARSHGVTRMEAEWR